jgi:hypothetical protein
MMKHVASVRMLFVLSVAALFVVSVSANALAAGPGPKPTDTMVGQVTVNNPPTIDSMELRPGPGVDPISWTIIPTPDGNTPFTVRVTCSDQDGWQNLASVTVIVELKIPPTPIYETETSTIPNPTGNPNQAYFDVVFNGPPYYTDPKPVYQLRATVTDRDGLTATMVHDGHVEAILGITLDTPTPPLMDFGTLTYGKSSDVKTATIHNSANMNIRVFVYGTDFMPLAGGINSIPIKQLKASVAQSTGWQDMSLSPGQQLDSLMIPFGQLAPGPQVPTLTYWMLVMPDGSTPLRGTYQSTITFQAMA